MYGMIQSKQLAWVSPLDEARKRYFTFCGVDTGLQSVSSSCAQHALRLLHVLEVPCSPFDKERLNAQIVLELYLMYFYLTAKSSRKSAQWYWPLKKEERMEFLHFLLVSMSDHLQHIYRTLLSLYVFKKHLFVPALLWSLPKHPFAHNGCVIILPLHTQETKEMSRIQRCRSMLTVHTCNTNASHARRSCPRPRVLSELLISAGGTEKRWENHHSDISLTSLSPLITLKHFGATGH